jgi:hypothetical protein
MHDDATDSDCGCGHEETLVFDDQGNLSDEVLLPGREFRPSLFERLLRPRPCAIGTLNGSWLLEIEPARRFPGTVLSSYVRGPMRIEVGSSLLRISGDIYTQRQLIATSATALAAPPTVPWYPQLPPSEYAWYFRSTGCVYSGGTLQISLVRHLWNRAAQEFVSTDAGTMQLTCQRPLITVLGSPTVMTGTATFGGVNYTVRATQTSTLQRGCRVEVDVMRNRTWPATANLCSGAGVTFESIYATAGWDIRLTVDELNVPEDAELTNAELQTLLTNHRAPAPAGDWRLWLFVGSNMGGLFGLMFDDDTIPREGAVGFADPRFGNQNTIQAAARGQELGDVPLAFLRTLVHEAGHAFNLFHPKHDVHAPAIGTSIMNQTGDVMGFATVTNPYPCNATMAFDDHSRTSLLHSPDPQVRPGWRNFGWGHGSLFAGVPAPVDADGLTNVDDADDLELAIAFPDAVFVGEYVYAEVTVTNVGEAPREVTTRLNLAEGDLRFLRRRPDGRLDQVRDIVVACGPRPTAVLEPGQSMSSRVQVFFTNLGYTFEEPGIHDVVAELDPGDGVTIVRSAPARLQVRMPGTDDERDIAQATLDRSVGRALAFGDFGSDTAARDKLAACAEGHADADTGAACALVLANALSRRHVEYVADGADTVRAPDNAEARRYLDLAVQGRSAEKVLALATTVASPVERDAPVVENALARVKRARKPKADVARAEDLAAGFVDPTPS